MLVGAKDAITHHEAERENIVNRIGWAAWAIFWGLVEVLIAFTYLDGLISGGRALIAALIVFVFAVSVPFGAQRMYDWLRCQPEGSRVHLVVGPIVGLATVWMTVVVLHTPILWGVAIGAAVCWIYWKVWRIV